MRNLDFPFDTWTTFSGTLTDCDKIRNRYAHSVWYVHETDGLCIQDTKGEWPKSDPRHNAGKKAAPGRIPINEGTLETDLGSIKKALEQLREFIAKLDAALASRGK
jgi:hypothetical protein